MTTDTLDMDALRGLLDAATPGPWRARGYDPDAWEVVAVEHEGRELERSWAILDRGNLGDPYGTGPDAALIATLRNQAPAMLAEIGRLTRERDAVVEAVRELHQEGAVWGMPVCRTCYSRTEDGDMESADWPCETIRALDAATQDWSDLTPAELYELHRRIINDDGTRHPIEDVAAEFGVDLDEPTSGPPADTRDGGA